MCRFVPISNQQPSNVEHRPSTRAGQSVQNPDNRDLVAGYLAVHRDSVAMPDTSTTSKNGRRGAGRHVGKFGFISNRFKMEFCMSGFHRNGFDLRHTRLIKIMSACFGSWEFLYF